MVWTAFCATELYRHHISLSLTNTQSHIMCANILSFHQQICVAPLPSFPIIEWLEVCLRSTFTSWRLKQIQTIRIKEFNLEKGEIHLVKLLELSDVEMIKVFLCLLLLTNGSLKRKLPECLNLECRWDIEKALLSLTNQLNKTKVHEQDHH